LEGGGRCKKPGLLVGRKEKGSWGQNVLVLSPHELGFIPLSAYPWTVHWWVLSRSGHQAGLIKSASDKGTKHNNCVKVLGDAFFGV
jgi:hypothetical protein